MSQNPSTLRSSTQTQEQEAKLQLPAEIREKMKRYGERYNLLKTPRQLRWQPHQGQVSVRGVISL